MEIRKAFARALKQARLAKGLTQEDFSVVSSRTYLSLLEREQKSPTLDKIEEIASVLGIHPLTLLAFTYMQAGKGQKLDALLKKVEKELKELEPEQ